jgi:hypothetical protein
LIKIREGDGTSEGVGARKVVEMAGLEGFEYRRSENKGNLFPRVSRGKSPPIFADIISSSPMAFLKG